MRRIPLTRLLVMPIRQYFLCVGSVLLVALLVANWLLPEPVAHPHSEIPPSERVNLRIRSDQKWPARIVFDTMDPRPSLAAEAHPSLDVASTQDLARQGPLNGLAALEPAPAASAATNDKLSATHAKPRPEEFRMMGTAKAD